MTDNRNLLLALGISLAIFIAGYIFLNFTDSKSNNTQKISSEKMPIETWFKVLSDRVPGELCNSPSYLEQCYKLEPEVCLIELQSQIRTCFEERRASMPMSLRGPKDAAFWGSKLVDCTITEVEKSHAKKQSKDKYCRSLTSWINDRPGGKVLKAQFIFTLEFELPKRLCEAKNFFFRRCFELDDQQCYDEASLAVNSCLEKYDSAIQGDVRVPVDSLPFTNTITNCSIQILTNKFSSQKRSDCNDSSLLEKDKNPN